MRRIATAMSVIILAFTIIIQAQTKSESFKQELMRLENEWADAMVKTEMTKADLIASLKSGDLRVVSMSVDDICVRIYGDTAVVTGRTALEETFKGEEHSG
jgi:hypothetical protein